MHIHCAVCIDLKLFAIECFAYLYMYSAGVGCYKEQDGGHPTYGKGAVLSKEHDVWNDECLEGGALRSFEKEG